jgi:hypothetical protein
LTKLGYLMDIANDLDQFVRAVAEIGRPVILAAYVGSLNS